MNFKNYGILCVKVLATRVIELCILESYACRKQFYSQNVINIPVNHYDVTNALLMLSWTPHKMAYYKISKIANIYSFCQRV